MIGGFAVVGVASREEALEWAAKIAVSCRCAQEVRELLPDPEQDAMLRRSPDLARSGETSAPRVRVGARGRLASVRA